LAPLVAAELGGKAIRRCPQRLRRVGRALGTVREVDVALELLEELTGDGQTPRDAAVRLRQHLDDLRSVARREMVGELARADATKLSRRLEKLVGDLRGAGTGAWTQTLALRLSARGGQLRDAVDAAGVLYVPDRLHAVRIAAKKLRYGFELAAEAGATRRRLPARQLKAVQDTLGRLHDIEVLTSLIQEVPVPATRSVRWVTHVDEFRHRLEAECRRLHGEFIGQRRRLNRAAADTATRILSRPAGGVVTPAPLKMTLADKRPRSGQRVFNG
jgi:CHAD domain-containing protein